MSSSWPGNMRGPRVKTPLLLLLLLLTSLTGTETEAQEDVGDSDQVYEETESPELLSTVSDGTLSPYPPATEEPGEETIEEELGSDQEPSSSGDEGVSTAYTENPNTMGSTDLPLEDEQTLDLIIIPILVGLVVVIIGMLVCGIFIIRRWNKNKRNQELRKDDPYLEGSSAEKVPMPMFEEDVPSVLELEMEELDQWMKKDSEIAEESKNA